MKNSSNIEDFLKNNEKIVDSEKLAEILNVAPRTIRFWVETQGAPKLDRGKYPVYEFLQWRYRKLEQDLEIAKSEIDERLISLKIESQKLINMEHLQKLKKLLKSCVIFEDVKQAWKKERLYIQSKLDELAIELNEGLQNVSDRNERFRIINTLVNDKMLQMSNDKTL